MERMDMEIYGSRYVKVRLTSMSEHHHGEDRGMLTRIRVELLPSTFCKVLTFASLVMAGLLFLYVWPFSRPAILIPMFLWTMYLVNKALVVKPVLNLIDEVAEKTGSIRFIRAGRPVETHSQTAGEGDDIDAEQNVATI